MKILILGLTKVKYMPYMNFFFDNIDKIENEVHILYWNRDLQSEDLSKYQGCIFHEFKFYQEDDVSKISKIINFTKYRKYTKILIKKGKFDFLFVLHSLTGFLVIDLLKKNYRDKYIFDYRDSTYESFPPFKKIVDTITRNACATFVSSDAFRDFLPYDCKAKIYTSHNLLIDSLEHRDEKTRYGVSSNKIRIAFWGFIRNEELNQKMITILANDSRFELHYYGREQQVALNLKAYVKSLSAENIFFHGEYVPMERYNFVRETDIIHNVYEDRNMIVAMGNKYYDGLIFRIPQICMPGSFMGSCVEQAQVGFIFDPSSESFADDIFYAYRSLDRDKFNSNCDKELERVMNEYNKGIDIIRNSTSNNDNIGSHT